MILPAESADVSATEGSCAAASSGMRIALYSHDTMGLGHMRRNMMIAQRLAAMPGATTLLICGAAEGGAFPMPPGVDCLTLPSFHKDEAGRYGSRRLRVSLDELVRLRSGILTAALGAYDPHVFIVDNVPRGAEGELNATLAALRRRGRTRCVLGLRDVLDDPAAIRRQWRQQAHEQAIRHYYDSIWVYGDPAVYDLASEYALADDIAAKVQYTGLLDFRQRLPAAPSSDAASVAPKGQGRIALCMVGGGQDGDRLATAFAAAALPPDVLGVLMMGPYMPAVSQERFKRLMSSNSRFRAIDFVTEPASLLNSADRVVAMAGYNTVYELLSFNKHGLVVPRTKPRSEQLIRAERLRALGVLEMLHPDELTPAAISRWLALDLRNPPHVRDRMEWNGLERLPKLLDKLLAGGPSHS